MSVLDDLFAQVDGGKSGLFSWYPLIEWHGEVDYLHKLNTPRFSFRRWTQEVITPCEFKTDGGSIPRLAWNLPGMNPWTYLNAYIIHDHLFTTHEKRPGVPCTFEESNLILAEALSTAGCPRYRIMLIYDAVAEDGRKHWDKTA